MYDGSCIIHSIITWRGCIFWKNEHMKYIKYLMKLGHDIYSFLRLSLLVALLPAGATVLSSAVAEKNEHKYNHY